MKIVVWVVQTNFPTHAVQAVFATEPEARKLAEQRGYDVFPFVVKGNLMAQYMEAITSAKKTQPGCGL
jgi:hypothetical protein